MLGRGFTWKFQVLFSLKNNEKVLMNAICSCDWSFKGQRKQFSPKWSKFYPVNLLRPATPFRVLCKLCRPSSDDTECGILSVQHCLLTVNFIQRKQPSGTPKTRNELIQMKRMDQSSGEKWVKRSPLVGIVCPGCISIHLKVSMTRHWGYKKNFMLDSAELEIFPAHKCENANNCWHFDIYEQEK